MYYFRICVLIQEQFKVTTCTLLDYFYEGKTLFTLTILFNFKSTDYMFMFLLNMSQKLKPAASELILQLKLSSDQFPILLSTVQDRFKKHKVNTTVK